MKDVVLGLDFESVATHTIDFDPNAETKTMEGRNGEFDVMPVKEAGKLTYLSLSNKSLLRQLQNITEPCRLKLTRTGSSYDTKYIVEKVK